MSSHSLVRRTAASKRAETLIINKLEKILIKLKLFYKLVLTFNLICYYHNFNVGIENVLRS